LITNGLFDNSYSTILALKHFYAPLSIAVFF
jgi:hypothetical protein